MANEVFDIEANESDDGIKVVSVSRSWIEDDNTPDWFTPTVSYGMTEGGVLVPKRVTDDGQQEVKQTGSIALVDKELDYSISAGSKTYVVNNAIRHKKSLVYVSADENHDYEVKISYDLTEEDEDEGTFNTQIAYEIYASEFTSLSSNEDLSSENPLVNLGPRIKVRVINNSSEDHSYDVYVWGVE